MDIHGTNETKGLPITADLNTTIVIAFMVEQFDLLADECNRRLEELTIEGDGPVFGHPSSCENAEVVREVG